MAANEPDIHAAEILEETREITLAELTRTCRVHADWVIELVEEGVIEPVGRPAGARGPQWRFSSTTIVRIEKARRLQRDLGVNLPGVALALQLLERIDALESRLRAMPPRPLTHDEID